jgi:hypothetical protein
MRSDKNKRAWIDHAVLTVRAIIPPGDEVRNQSNGWGGKRGRSRDKIRLEVD